MKSTFKIRVYTSVSYNPTCREDIIHLLAYVINEAEKHSTLSPNELNGLMHEVGVMREELMNHYATKATKPRPANHS